MEFEILGFKMVAWKLHSGLDYFLFISVCVGAIIVFILLTKRLGRLRNDESAAKRSLKKFGWACKKGFFCVPVSATRLAGKVANLVLFAPDGIYLVRCFGWGFKVSGALRTATWKVADNKEERRIPNPIIELRPEIEEAQKLLEKAGLDVPVSHLIIFADPYNSPTFALEYGANSIGIRHIKKWYKTLSTYNYDVQKAKAALCK